MSSFLTTTFVFGCSHSRKTAVKLMHMLPSHAFLLFFFTFPGILDVFNSSRRWRTPDLLRNPTIILGTPSRNDWIQNLRSFLSNLAISRSFWISSEVFSSTQLTGRSLTSGLKSHTGVTRLRLQGPRITLADITHLHQPLLLRSS